MTPVCFLDMDGVLFDFVKGVCQLHGKENPYTDPKNHGKFEIDEIWGMTPSEFWKPINNNEKFWHKLEKMQGADEIVAAAIAKYGVENVGVLTAPSLDPECVPGKRACIRRHFPALSRQIIFASAKHFLARPGALLVDDRDKNVDEFNEFGGTGVLVPRLWNKAYEYADMSTFATLSLMRLLGGV